MIDPGIGHDFVSKEIQSLITCRLQPQLTSVLGLFTVSICIRDCDITEKIDTIDFCGNIQINRHQPSKKEIANAKTIAHCVRALINLFSTFALLLVHKIY